ncbi:MAG: peptidoglycan-binding protein, partial [Clostridia bacterium]|nr:peptidoglycan-binding protein [Clostridia bacterium]
THFGIGKKGEIHQYVSEEHAAWGNGLLTNPNWEWAKVFPGVNPNLYSLSYELEGMSGEIPTAEQWNALIYLLKFKSAEYGIPIERRRFVGHYMIDPVNRAGCPGAGFPWDRLFQEFNISSSVTKISFPVIAFGAKGEAVRYLQAQLNARGFDCGVVDGEFGEKTLKALVNFQRAKGLTADGIVGPITWAHL